MNQSRYIVFIFALAWFLIFPNATFAWFDKTHASASRDACGLLVRAGESEDGGELKVKSNKLNVEAKESTKSQAAEEEASEDLPGGLAVVPGQQVGSSGTGENMRGHGGTWGGMPVGGAWGVPVFFGGAGEALASYAVDPDRWRHDWARHLHGMTSANHYLDYEYVAQALAGKGAKPQAGGEEAGKGEGGIGGRVGENVKGMAMWRGRYEFVRWCDERGLKAEKVGMAPFAVAELAERLVLGFAEHRRDPTDQAVQAKCLVVAGELAHYVQDLCQPLHTTIHYDGQVDVSDGLTGHARSPRTGIHFQVDSLPEKLQPAERAAIVAEAKPQRWADDLDGVAIALALVSESHAWVDRVYAMSDALPGKDAKMGGEDGQTWAEPVRDFVSDRYRATVEATAGIWLWAWEKSATVKVVEWD